MREILFKAKHIAINKWYEGYYVKMERLHYICVLDEGFENGYRLVEINQETLCQYTGLTDKHGMKIWENDILRGHKNDDDLVRVVFGEYSVIDVDTLETVDRVVGWHTEVIETDALSKCEPFCIPMPLADFYIKRSEFEVFGNIFDNADLLEVK